MGARLSREEIAVVVERVVERLGAGGQAPAAPAGGCPNAVSHPMSARAQKYQGVFEQMDDAVGAAIEAAGQLNACTLDDRRRMIESMRCAAREVVPYIAKMAVEETGLGRAEDKIIKNHLVIDKTPGPEILQPTAFSGDDGLALMERAPYGVIGAITPSTNPTETIICNSIGMVSGGNAVVFNAHPSATQVCLYTIDVLNRAIERAGGPRHVLTSVAEPTIPTAQTLMRHPSIRVVVVTGGPGVVREAMSSGKNVIAAGPGNPPIVIDETANIPDSAKHIMQGATIDNNIVCVAEKEILAVEKIADELKGQLKALGAIELNDRQIEQITKLVVQEPPSVQNPHGAINRAWVGKDAHVILEQIGVRAERTNRMVLCEVPFEHPLVQIEQLMPVIPLVRVRDVDTAIDLALEAEHGFGHTAVMYSRNIEKLSHMASIINTSIFVKNGNCLAGLGYGGEGYTSFTIASPTGHGMTTAVHFTRERRCTLKEYFRIV